MRTLFIALAVFLLTATNAIADSAVVCTAVANEGAGLLPAAMDSTPQQDGSVTFSYKSASYEMYATYSPGSDAVSALITSASGDTAKADAQKPSSDYIVKLESGGAVSAAITCDYVR